MLGQPNKFFLWVALSKREREKKEKKSDPTSMPAGDPIIVHPKRNWCSHGGLGHSGPAGSEDFCQELHNGCTSQQDAECTTAKNGRNCRL